MTTKHEGGDIFNRDIELLSNKRAHTGRIQNTGHTDHTLPRETGYLFGSINHGIEWIGHHQNHTVRRIGNNLPCYICYNLYIGSQQVITAHARFTGNACSNNHQIRIRGINIVLCAGYRNIITLNR